VTSLQVAWLAGLLEGEGSFRFQRRRGVIVQFTTTDLDIAERAAALLSVRPWGPYRDKYRERKPYWQVRVCSSRAVGLMFSVFSFLGERRRQQVKESLSEWRTVRAMPAKIWRRLERQAA
jgi:hypothetical protein